MPSPLPDLNQGNSRPPRVNLIGLRRCPRSAQPPRLRRRSATGRRPSPPAPAHLRAQAATSTACRVARGGGGMPAGKLLPVRIGDVYVETLPAVPAVGSEPTSVFGRERPQEAAGVEQVADVFSRAQETILSIATTTAAVLEKAGRAAVHHESLEVEFGIAFSGWSSRRRSPGLQSACQRSSGTRGVLRRHSTSSSPCSGVSSTMSFGCSPSF